MRQMDAAPITANSTLAAASAIFSWGVREEFAGVSVNPCHGVVRNETKSRSRVLSDAEIKLFWQAFGSVGLVEGAALKMILITAQRPGEVRFMRAEHIIDGCTWQMPGKPVGQWPGVKNGADHMIHLSEPARQIISCLTDGAREGFVFNTERGGAVARLDGTMREISTKLGVPAARPHDLRRTSLTIITKLGLGRHLMDVIANHRQDTVTDVYDRHGYEGEVKKAMEAIANHILAVAEGRHEATNVVPLTTTRGG